LKEAGSLRSYLRKTGHAELPKPEEIDMPTDNGPLPTPIPTRKIIKAEVVGLGNERYGVAFEYDDGHKETIEAATRESAELAAKGDLVPIVSTDQR